MTSKTNFNQNWTTDTNGKMVHVDKPRKLLGKQLENYKTGLTLNQHQKEVLIGLLLGDAYVNYHRESKNPTFYIEFAQSAVRADYVDHVYQILKPFVGSPPKINLIGGIKPDKLKRYEARFKTYGHPEFQTYYDLFYPLRDGKRVKRVPKNIAYLLTPKGLAYWYMDDGTTDTAGVNNKKQYVISTQGFRYSDQKLLVNALKVAFNINAGIHKDKTYSRLYIYADSRDQFLNRIKDYVVADFFYKL